MQKLSNFIKNSADIISQSTTASVTDLIKEFVTISIDQSKNFDE
jgi:hypothetical protein